MVNPILLVTEVALPGPGLLTLSLISRGSKMGEVRINLTNFITVGAMAFVGVWLINKGLAYAGKQNWQA